MTVILTSEDSGTTESASEARDISGMNPTTAAMVMVARMKVYLMVMRLM